MKKPTLIISLLLVVSISYAGIGSFLTQKNADWEFIQKTGSLRGGIIDGEVKYGAALIH